ncbi:thermostable hemolysin, partial [Acinetobacter baumannii]
MVFSATGQVAAMVDKVGLPTRALALADPARLTGSVDDWGSYYESAPRVMVGDVQAAFAALSLQPALAAALALIAPLAHPMAEHLRRRQL